MGHSFAEVHPELVCEWSEKNAPLKVTDITYGSNKRYWWIGKCGHEWLASPIPRDAFSQTVIYSLGAFRTIFKAKHEDEIMKTINKWKEERR